MTVKYVLFAVSPVQENERLAVVAAGQPVKQILDKMKADGLMATFEAVFRNLDEPLPPG